MQSEADQTKPHKGRVENWIKHPCGSGLGYLILGTFAGHPEFDGEYGNTSYYVIKHKGDEIETKNSRYTLGRSAIDPDPTASEYVPAMRSASRTKEPK